MGVTGNEQATSKSMDRFLESVLCGYAVCHDVSPANSYCIFGCGPAATACKAVSDLSDSSLNRPVPFVTDRRVPGWVGKDTLCIVVGPEGSDVVSERLTERGARVVWTGTPDTECVAGFHLGSALSALVSAGLVSRTVLTDAVASARSLLSGYNDQHDILDRLRGRIPAFYSTSEMSAAAMWWSQAISDAMGVVSFYGELPEFDHNELVGWSDSNAHAPNLEIVILKGSCESKMVQTIVGCMIEVLLENGRDVTVIDIPGDDQLTADLCAICIAQSIVDSTGETV